jgi:hypothetical protein
MVISANDIQQSDASQNKTAAQAINALSLIFREAVRSKCHAEEFGKILLSVSSLNFASCNVLEKVWRKYSSSLLSSSKVWKFGLKHLSNQAHLTPWAEQVKCVLSIGRLAGFEWKFGVSTESSACSKLNSPFVILLFRIADTDGMVCPDFSNLDARSNSHNLCTQVKSHCVEMSVSEFNEFAESLNSIVAVLDTL